MPFNAARSSASCDTGAPPPFALPHLVPPHHCCRRSSQIASSTARASPSQPAHPEPLRRARRTRRRRESRRRPTSRTPNPSSRSRTRYNDMSCETHTSSCGRSHRRLLALTRPRGRASFAARSAGHHHVGRHGSRRTTARETDLTCRRRHRAVHPHLIEYVEHAERFDRTMPRHSVRLRRHDLSGSIEQFRRSAPPDSRSRAPTDSSAALSRNARQTRVLRRSADSADRDVRVRIRAPNVGSMQQRDPRLRRTRLAISASVACP